MISKYLLYLRPLINKNIVVLTYYQIIMKVSQLLITLAFTIIAISSSAANRYWISNLNSNWNNTANWAATSGGNGGETVPGSNDLVYFNANGIGICTLDMDVIIDGLNMQTGAVELNTSTYNFTINGASNSYFIDGTINGSNTFTIHPSGASTKTYFQGTIFNVAVDAVGPDIKLNGTTFNSTSYFHKNGGSSTIGSGGNTFVGHCTLKNSSSGYIALQSGGNDYFQANLTLINEGAGLIYLGHKNSTTNIAGDLTISNILNGKGLAISGINCTINVGGNCMVTTNSSSNTGISLGQEGVFNISGLLTVNNLGSTDVNNQSQVYIANKASSVVTTGGINVNNSGTSYTCRLYIGNSGDVIINGPTNINNTAEGNNSFVYFTNIYGSNIQFNDNITLSASGVNCKGVVFGNSNSAGGISTLASGKTISLGLGGYDAPLSLSNFTQLGSTPQSLIFTTNNIITFTNNEWNGDINIEACYIYFKNNTYNEDASIKFIGTPTQAVQQPGGNTYNGNTIIEQNATKTLYLGRSSASYYHGDLTLIKSGTGILYPAFGHHSTLKGNLYLDINSDLSIAHETNKGMLVFNGTAAQSINKIGTPISYTISFGQLKTDNLVGEITLNTPISIKFHLNLTNGNIVTSNTNLLFMITNSVVDVVSDDAYIAGPMKKEGKDAFVFPIGDGGHYSGIGISASGNWTYVFQAEYHASMHADATNFAATIEKVSLVEYWDLAQTNGSATLDVTLYFPDANRSGISSPSDLRVVHYDGSIWEDKGISSSTANSVTATGISSFSPFTIGTVDEIANPLPIDLLTFNIEKQEDDVRIDWSTASEINNEYFIIERTVDFKNIEEVQTIAGANNSNEILYYTVYDNKPLKGNSYYRLTQVDFNGNQENFEWKSIRFGRTLEPTLSIYPNPSTNGELSIYLENIMGNTELKIQDILGRILYRKVMNIEESNSKIALDLNLSSGIYFIQIMNKEKAYTQRLIIK